MLPPEEAILAGRECRDQPEEDAHNDERPSRRGHNDLPSARMEGAPALTSPLALGEPSRNAAHP